MNYVLVAGLSYLLGGVPFGLLLTKLVGRVDVRDYGSKRTGATNVSRVLGRKWGFFVFFLDLLKGVAGVLLGRLLVGDGWAEALGALAAVLGHIFPLFFGFRGGRGVATAMGGVIALVPWAFPAAFVVWWATVLLTRYVSLGSILSGMAVAAGAGLLMAFERAPLPAFLYGLAVAIIVIGTHHDNIRRLLNGTESRWGQRVQS